MKFYSTCNHTTALELSECTLLKGVSIVSGGQLKLDDFGEGWIYESDEYFPSFCQIKYGFEPVVIEENQYKQLLTDGITFVSKSRKKQLNKCWADYRKKNR